MEIQEQLKGKGIELKGEKRRMYFRGEVWMADLGQDNKEEGEQRGYRPVVIVQNERGNLHSNTLIVASVTSQTHKTNIPTHQVVELNRTSIIMYEQMFTVSKCRLTKMIGRLDEAQLVEMNYRLAMSLGLASC